ncbi:MAG: hypothetical protein ABIC19_03390 [Patescibacteria group bacterium]
MGSACLTKTGKKIAENIAEITAAKIEFKAAARVRIAEAGKIKTARTLAV